MCLQVINLLKGIYLEQASVLITSLPEEARKLSPLCDKKLVNLGLDSTRQDAFIRRYAVLARGRGKFANDFLV